MPAKAYSGRRLFVCGRACPSGAAQKDQHHGAAQPHRQNVPGVRHRPGQIEGRHILPEETAAQKIHGIYRMFLLKSFWNFWPLNRWTSGICVMNKKNRISCSSFCVKNISLFPGIIGSVFGWEHILFCGSGGNKLIVCIHSCQCCNTQKKKFFCAFFHGNPPCI